MRLAVNQIDIEIGRPDINIRRIVDSLHALSSRQVELSVYPEAAVTGYCADSRVDALSISVGLQALDPIRNACDEKNVSAVVGFAERDGESIRNSAALFEPGTPPRVYRKTHLPYLGLDRFAEAGSHLQTFDTRWGSLGILICFDMRYPEAARSLALQGAELIVIPTNWPEGAEVSAEHISIARAAENRVFVATCNRIGEENGFRFIGGSKVVSPTGRVLAEAGSNEEACLIVDIDLTEARQKRTITIPGRYETDVFASRRVELYHSTT